MKKLLLGSGLVALMMIVSSCDPNFDLGNLDNSMTLMPNATIPFPSDAEKHHDLNMCNLWDTNINNKLTSKTYSENFEFNSAQISSGVVLAKPILVDFKDVPLCLSDPESIVKFEKAPVKVELENPVPGNEITVTADIVADGKNLSKTVSAKVEAKSGKQTIEFDVAPFITNVPEKLELKNVTFKSSTTKAVAPLATTTLSLNYFADFELRFLPQTKLVFNYSFDDFAFDLAGLNIDARNIAVKAKISSTFPISIEGGATDREKDFTAVLSKIPAMAKDADVTLSAKCQTGLKKITNVQLKMVAVNESSQVAVIDNKCSLSIDLKTIVLPDGFDVK